MKKQMYQEPSIEVLSLESEQETLQAASLGSVGGQDLGSPDIYGGDWTDMFNIPML